MILIDLWKNWIFNNLRNAPNYSNSNFGPSCELFVKCLNFIHVVNCALQFFSLLYVSDKYLNRNCKQKQNITQANHFLHFFLPLSVGYPHLASEFIVTIPDNEEPKVVYWTLDPICFLPMSCSQEDQENTFVLGKLSCKRKFTDNLLIEMENKGMGCQTYQWLDEQFISM